jgi:hypothetical protein
MKRNTRIRATSTKLKLAAIAVVLKNHLSPLLSGPADSLRLTGAGLVAEASLMRASLTAKAY